MDRHVAMTIGFAVHVGATACFMSYRLIDDKSACSEATAIRSVKRLEATGWLKIIRSAGRRANTFTLVSLPPLRFPEAEDIRQLAGGPVAGIVRTYDGNDLQRSRDLKTDARYCSTATLLSPWQDDPAIDRTGGRRATLLWLQFTGPRRFRWGTSKNRLTSVFRADPERSALSAALWMAGAVRRSTINPCTTWRRASSVRERHACPKSVCRIVAKRRTVRRLVFLAFLSSKWLVSINQFFILSPTTGTFVIFEPFERTRHLWIGAMKIVGPEQSGSQSGEASLAEDLRTLVRAFTCRWRMVAGIVLLCVLAGFTFVWLAPKAYTSTVSIFIDPRERSLVDLGVAPTGMGSSSQGADGALVDSQMTILTSRSVLGTLVEQERLDADPSFIAVATGALADLRGLAGAVLYGPDRVSAADVPPFDRALASLQKAVEVKRVDNTYVLNVSVTTSTPTRSAALANALAGIYVNNGQTVIDASARESAASLEARLAELGRAAEESQRAVEEYRRENGLLDTDGVPLAERQVGELSSQLVSASVATEAARVALETLRDNGGGTSVSETASQLRMEIGQARAEESVLSDTYGPRYPKLLRAQKQRKALEKALDDELARVFAKADADYRSAAGQQAALKDMLAKSQENLTRSNAASVKLKELEQTAKQNRELFDSFTTKAKQAREQISLPTTTARIISSAQPAMNPSAPKALVVLAASIFLGCVAGFGTAWLLYLLIGPPKRRHPTSVSPLRKRHLAAAE